MKIATWNVNSINVRLEHVLSWCALEKPDVLALQETKSVDEKFPVEAFEAAGYQATFSGQATYNGVAVLSRVAARDCVTDLEALSDPQRRILAVTVGDVRLINLYVPNGSSVGSDKYAYKLNWLDHVIDFIDASLQQHERCVVVGDFNIAPEDRDVHDPESWEGHVLVSPKERAAFSKMCGLGMVDCFRLFDAHDVIYSWWDYRQAAFRRNRGLRIDHIMASQAMAAHCKACHVDREPRTWERPSDHAPVVAVFGVD